VNKPWGWSSHDVVGTVRRLAGTRAVGHAGTLDPLASGVLVLALGRATRVLERAMDLPKCYAAEVYLGMSTATDDAEGPPSGGRPLEGIDEARITRELAGLTGVQEQRPPAFAAIKVGGKAAYEAARQGEELELAARTVTIYGLALLRLRLPYLTLGVWCSRGTYIRALARDLGERLGCGAYLAGLVRVSVGPFHLRSALGLETVAALAEAGRLAGQLYAPETVLAGRPVLLACAESAADVRHGRAVRPPAGGWHRQAGTAPAGPGASWALGPDGRLLALGEIEVGSDGAWRPRRVLGGEA
jgi:tRNA pseudouridine55 synthase